MYTICNYIRDYVRGRILGQPTGSFDFITVCPRNLLL